MAAYISLKYNLETKLSADAAGLSGGKRQRLSFLRSAYAEGGLILLDEPTSNLDKAASETVYGSIRKCFSGKTVSYEEMSAEEENWKEAEFLLQELNLDGLLN